MCAHAGAVATAQAALASVRKRGSFATVRKTQRLKTLVRNANLVDYWSYIVLLRQTAATQV